MSVADRVYKTQGLQGLLTIGYLFIVVLGIIGEALYYSQLGINILKYSTITDVLLSPISKITLSAYFILLILGISFISYLVSQRLNTVEKRNKFRKILFNFKIAKNPNGSLKDTFLMVISSLLFGFYVGLDFGNGTYTAKNLREGNFKYNDRIYFNNNDSTQAEIVGSNTAYIFYVKKNSKVVQVSPMGAIKSFENSVKSLTLSNLKSKN
jgi:hypothetical protein